MLIKSSYNRPQSSDIYYGEVVNDLKENRLYTINLNYTLFKADYPRKIVEFKDFKPDSFQDGYLLSVDITNNKNSFTLTSLPFLSIDRLGGTSLPSTDNVQQRLNKYLGINEVINEVINAQEKVAVLNKPDYSLFDLGDVTTLTEIGKQDADGYSITYLHDETPSTKDYFTVEYPGRWVLLPELKSLQLADDVFYTDEFIESGYRVLRQSTRLEFRDTGRLVRPDTLHIGWDGEPSLLTPLNFNGFSSFNEQYSFSNVGIVDEDFQDPEDEDTVLTTTYTFDIDFNKQVYSLSNLSETTEILRINFIEIPDQLNRLKVAVLDIRNYEGLLLFSTTTSARIMYENGIANLSAGKRNIFNIHSYSDRIYITHKAINLNSTNYTS